MYEFIAILPIVSKKSLEEVGQIISDAIFGGVPFTGKEENLCDEIPCVVLSKFILGLSITLQQGKDQIYYLSASPSNSHTNDGYEVNTTDLSVYFGLCLKDIEGLEINMKELIDWQLSKIVKRVS
jgi:hypothetical protein